MNYGLIIGKSFYIIGLAVRISNVETAAEQIGQLWNKFYSVINEIPNQTKNGGEFYGLYTDYKSLSDYTAIVGVQVTSLNNIPSGFIGKEIPEQKYALFSATGNVPNVTASTWHKIWNTNLNRAFSIDFEKYKNMKSDGSTDLEIYIAIK